MLQTLGEIFNHINDQLLDGELESINDVLQFLEECQQRLSIKYPIEAPIVSLTLTSNEITVPADLQKLNRITVDGVKVAPTEVWGDVIYLPTAYKAGTAKLYYYKKPTALDPGNLLQVPDIDSRFFPAMAKYAASMYYLVDDDSDMREAFRSAFYADMDGISVSKETKCTFTNLW